MKELNISMYCGISFLFRKGRFVKWFPTISSSERPVICRHAVLHEVTTPFKSIVAIPLGANSTMFLYLSSDSLNLISACFHSVISSIVPS